MRPTAKLTLALTVLTAAIAPSALAANGDCRAIRGAETPDPSDDVTVCRQDNWFHQATTKLGNGVAANQSFPSWNSTKPTASATQGAGGGYVTNSITHQPAVAEDLRATATFVGSYTGVMDNLAVELYGFTTPVVTGELNIKLVVDSWTLFDGASEVTVEPGNNQLTRFRFVFTNVYDALRGFQDPGGPGTVHALRLSVNGRYVVNDPIVFVYDTSEVPSGLVFNHEPSELGRYAKIDLAV